MPYYLSQYEARAVVGPTVVCVPVGSDEPGWAAIDLRPDGGATLAGNGLNTCLLYRPSPSLDARMTLVGLDAKDPIGMATAAAINAKLGTSVVPDTLERIVGSLMLFPPVNGWKPLRPEALGTLYAVYLGPLTWRLPVITGGVDLYRHLHEGGGVLKRCLARDGFRRKRDWRRFLMNERGGVLATDAFTRANATTLGTDYTPTSGDELDGGINTNRACVPTGGENVRAGGVRTANPATWPNDQYSQAVLALTKPDAVWFVRVRALTAAVSYYAAGYDVYNYTSSTILAKQVTGTFTVITDSGADNLALNDVAYLEVQGTSLLMKKNGTNLIGPSTDSALTAGKPGFQYRHLAADVGVLDDGEWGDFVAAAVKPGILFAGPIIGNLR